MGIKKNILIDGKEVPFKASAAVPRLYRLKFGRDIYRDFASLEDSVRQDSEKHANEEEKQSTLDIESLEMFENIAYIMARHADPENVPGEPDEWLEQFEMFSIYEVLPEILALWGTNLITDIDSKKNLNAVVGR